MELVFFAVVIFVGLQIMVAVSAFSSRKKIDDAIKDKIGKLIHTVKIEKVGEMSYWFDEDTDQFLSQGKTHEEIAVGLKQRFAKHVFLIDNEYALVGPDFAVRPYKDALEQIRINGGVL